MAVATLSFIISINGTRSGRCNGCPEPGRSATVEQEFRALGTGENQEKVMIVWNKKVVLFCAGFRKDNILYEKYSTNFHEKHYGRNVILLEHFPVKRKRDEIRDRNVGRNGCPCRGYKQNRKMPQNWQEKKPDVLQQGWGEQSGETVLQLAAFTHPAGRCDCFVGDRLEEAQSCWITMHCQPETPSKPSRDHCGIFRFWKIHADQADRDFPDFAWKRR